MAAAKDAAGKDTGQGRINGHVVPGFVIGLTVQHPSSRYCTVPHLRHAKVVSEKLTVDATTMRIETAMSIFPKW